MDGFFVAKFRVTKRAKPPKEVEELMDEGVIQEDVQFDEREDEGYIRGKSM